MDGYKSYFSWSDIRNMGKDLSGNLQNEAIGLQTGRINPWELPRFKQAAEGIRTQTARNTEGMGDVLRRSDVGGPAGALALERIGEGGNNSILNYANMVNSDSGAKIGSGISIGQKAYDNALKYLMFKQGQGQGSGIVGADQVSAGIGSLIGGIGKAGGSQPGQTQSPGGMQMNPQMFQQFMQMFQGGGGGGMGGMDFGSLQGGSFGPMGE